MKGNHKTKTARTAKILGLMFIMLLASVLAHSALSKHAKAAENKSGLTTDSVTAKRNHLASKAVAADISGLGNAINNIIKQNSDIDMSASIVDLGNGQNANFGDGSAFEAASVEKVLTAVYFLHEVEAGNETLSENINGYSAQYELQQMIVNSDDTAWQAFNDDLGYQNLVDYASGIGVNYDWSANALTTADIAQLLAKLWNDQLLNAYDTQLLLTYMEQANYRDYIIPAVPSGDFVYHKAGLYNDEVNDASIITNGKQAFVLVIFTNGNGVYNWPARAQMMQSITQAAITTYL